MKPIFEQAATAYVAPKLIRAFRWQWVIYGVAAYYGLRFLNKRGIFPKQTDAILNTVDRGIDRAKEAVGLQPGQHPVNEERQADILH